MKRTTTLNDDFADITVTGEQIADLARRVEETKKPRRADWGHFPWRKSDEKAIDHATAKAHP